MLLFAVDVASNDVSTNPISRGRFENVLAKAGLSINNLGEIVIAQDSRGFMWFGGQRGLARFDGKNFKLYNNDSDNPNNICSKEITDLHVHHDNSFWVGTRNGLCVFNEDADEFQRFASISTPGMQLLSNVISHIDSGKDNKLFLATPRGLSIVDRNKHSLETLKIAPKEENFWLGANIKEVFIDSEGEVWLGTESNGLIRRNLVTGAETHYKHDPNNTRSISGNNIHPIEQDRDGVIWIGTRGHGLNAFDKTTGLFTRYTHDPKIPSSIGSNLIWGIHIDKENNVWLAADPAGLSKFDRQTQSFSHFTHKTFYPRSISTNRLHTIFEDSFGNFWLAGFPRQLNFVNPQSFHVKNWHKIADTAISLNNNSVLTLFFDSKNTLWVGNEDGLNTFNKKINGFDKHTLFTAHGENVSKSAVLTITERNNGEIWLGTWGAGLHIIDPKTKRSRQFFEVLNETALLSSREIVWDINFSKNNDVVWISTENSGLHAYNLVSGEQRIFGAKKNDEFRLRDNYIWKTMEDSLGNIWVAMATGLSVINPKTNLVTDYSHLFKPKDRDRVIGVRTLYKSDDGTIWIGTMNYGLFRFIPALTKMEKIPTTDPHDSIMSILGDGDDIWFASANGLSRINTKTLDIENFTDRDGFANAIYTRSASARDQNGDLYFGGNNGFSSFSPKKLAPRSTPFNIQFIDFKIFFESVDFSSNEKYSKPPILLDTITLEHTESVFSFYFAALDYENQDGIEYVYKMKGFDKNWNFSGNSNIATYTNLNAGSYIFNLRAKNQYGEWSQNTLTKKIIIYPAPWHTWWAYTTYTVIVLILIIFGIQFRLRKLALHNEQKINTKLSSMDKVKDTFLANTSHELRTPISGMVGLAESILHSSDLLGERNRAKLEMIAGTGKRLSNLINDILDYSKLADNTIEIYTEAVNIHKLIDEIFPLLAPAIEGRPIQLINHTTPHTPLVIADQNRLQQILINLISNGIKYTDEGCVIISAEAEDEKNADLLTIRVSDTGIGIPENKLKSIFTAFDQVNHANGRIAEGTGLGLTVTKQLVELHGSQIQVSSTLSLGSEFYFTLKIAEANTASSSHSKAITGQSHTLKSLSSESASNDETASTQEATQNDKRFSVLIIDDDPVNRMILRGILEEKFYTVFEATGGQEGIQMLNNRLDIDIVILDIMMPRLSGLETCKIIRKEHKEENLPIIFLSAKSTNSDIADDDLTAGKLVGGSDFLNKPIDRELLLEKITKHLDKKKQRVSA